MRTSRPVLVTAIAAALVTAAGMAYAFAQRPSAQDEAGGDANLRCGTTVCQSVIGRGVDGDMVEALTGAGGGRIRVTNSSGAFFIFEMTIAEAGAKVQGDGALECTTSPSIDVCLVRGTKGDDVLGEALVRRGGVWSRVSATYLSTGAYLALHDVDKDGVADVVAVQRGCEGQCAFTQVFRVVGDDLGCTPPVDTKDEANRTPELSQLRPCAEA